MRIIPSLLCDFYKTSHKDQYPEGTEKIYSTWTPRISRIAGVDQVVAYGFQGLIKEWFMEYFEKEFFGQDVEEICSEYERYIKYTLGVDQPDSSHIRDLHALGYLPIKIMAVPEGTLVPIRVPMMTIESTHKNFAWITNYLESFMSAQLWGMSTSATIAYEYKRILGRWADLTVGNRDHLLFQAHDFSFRGMYGAVASYLSGSGHLLSFGGTDTIPAIMYLEAYYNANIEKELVGASIPATEHSVQCLYNDEDKYFNRMHQEVYPNGLVSIVSDGYDYWKMLQEVITNAKQDIMNREGKVVIRPDSGDPVKIICGEMKVEYDYDKDANFMRYNENISNSQDEALKVAQAWTKEVLQEKVHDDTPHGEMGETNPSTVFKYGGKYYKLTLDIFWNRHDKQFYYMDEVSIQSCEEFVPSIVEKGTIEYLWDVFGGTINELGYKVLDPHIGAIYGDSITLDRANEICKQLEAKGFASSNIVFGVGSYTYQYNTRDTFGFALKATYGVVNGEEKLIFKDPKTDSGVKKSQKGMVVVGYNHMGRLEFTDELTEEQRNDNHYNIMRTIYEDGKLIVDDSLAEIRARLK